MRNSQAEAVRDAKRDGVRRVLCLLLALAAISLPALAAKPITPEQLRQALVASGAARHPDDAVAQQLANTRLAVRLTGASLRQLLALSPGPKTTQALHAIADASAFVEPPPEELSPTPAPDMATQKAILGHTVDYVSHTLPALPNFLATRVTEHYVDTLRGLGSVDSEPRGPLFLIGGERTNVGFRDGRETDDPSSQAKLASSSSKAHAKDAKGDAKGTAAPNLLRGLSSWGEFGPILGVVLLDAAKSKLSWAHWQQEEGKPVAVFQFSVDRSKSHYSLNYCCELANGGPSDTPMGKNSATVWQPGYHGRLEVDPETGTILRITIEADLRPADPIQKASLMVEYAPVKIGDSTQICPVRSVTLSVAGTQILSQGALQTIERLRLNHTEFINYRRFGSESTLVFGDPSDSGVVHARDATASDTPPASIPASSAPVAAASSGEPEPTIAASATIAATPAPIAAPTPPPAAEMEAELVVTPAASLLGMVADSAGSATSGNANESSFTLQVTTRLVNLSLIATDRHGKPVTDLKQDEFEIYDDGRRQQIAAFHDGGAGAPTATAQAPALGTFTNAAIQIREASEPVQPGSASQDAPDLLILLIDESHLASNDLNQAHSEMLRFLKASRPDAKLALYSIGDHGFRVIQDVTQDHLLMVARLAAWKPDANAVAQTRELERREQQQAQNLQDAQDLHGLNIKSHGDILAAFPLGDPELAALGNNPLRLSLEGMTALARHFASVPGHKSLAWISGDRALSGLSPRFANSEAGKRAANRSSLQLEAAIAHTREALNDAQIAFYVVDASMPTLVGGGLDASRYSPGQETSPAATANQAPGGAGGPILGPQSSVYMQLDLAGIQGPLRSLAQATGGRAINRGDLVKALNGIEDDSKALYDIAFDPDTPADNKFHTLLVKIPSREDVKLRYRTGYEYNEESGNAQQRFQQAVWSPQDASAIKLTAEVAPASPLGTPGLKLRIAFPGLALEEKDSRWRDNLYVFIAQRDDATQKAEVSGDTLRLAFKQAAYESGMPAGIPYQRAVELKSKLGSVRVIVVDGNSGRMGSVTLPSSALNP